MSDLVVGRSAKVVVPIGFVCTTDVVSEEGRASSKATNQPCSWLTETPYKGLGGCRQTLQRGRAVARAGPEDQHSYTGSWQEAKEISDLAGVCWALEDQSLRVFKADRELAQEVQERVDKARKP
jgi:hypothetical protein